MITPSDPPSRDIAIVVIDDHEVIHAGVHLWCAQARPPIRIVGNYTTIDALARPRPGTECRIDVVAMDLELTSRRPDFAALEALVGAGHRVVVHSHLLDDEIILRCLDIGATSYVTKAEGRTHLIEALRAAADDRAYVAPRMAGALATDRNPGRPKLTDRETDALVAWFHTENKDLVAERLAVSAATVKTLLQRARTRYASAGRPAPTKAALIARAIQDGIVSVSDL